MSFGKLYHSCLSGLVVEQSSVELEIRVQIQGLPNLFHASFGVLACLDMSSGRWRLLDHVALLSGVPWPDLVGGSGY